MSTEAIRDKDIMIRQDTNRTRPRHLFTILLKFSLKRICEFHPDQETDTPQPRFLEAIPNERNHRRKQVRAHELQGTERT